MDTWAKNTLVMSRLIGIHQEHGNLIVATDFDDTVYPYTVEDSDHSEAIDVLQRCSARGWPITVQTCSDPERWPLIVDYLAQRKIKILGTNISPSGLKFGQPGKAYYNIMLDDRSGLGETIRVLSEFLDITEEEKERNK